MIANTNFNPTQTVNSFLKPMGLSLASKDQVTAKIKALALASIPLGVIFISSLSLTSASLCTSHCFNSCGGAASLCYIQCVQTNCGGHF